MTANIISTPQHSNAFPNGFWKYIALTSAIAVPWLTVITLNIVGYGRGTVILFTLITVSISHLLFKQHAGGLRFSHSLLYCGIVTFILYVTQAACLYYVWPSMGALNEILVTFAFISLVAIISAVLTNKRLFAKTV